MEEEVQKIENQGEINSILGFPLKIPTLYSLRKGGFILYGLGTLVAGVLTITDNRIKSSSSIFATYGTRAGTNGITLMAVCGEGSATITSLFLTATAPGGGGGITITGTPTASSDTSVVNYLVVF